MVAFTGLVWEPCGELPRSLHRTLDEHFLGNVEVFFERCQVGQRAVFFLPAP
jgi:hypothetical protein